MSNRCNSVDKTDCDVFSRFLQVLRATLIIERSTDLYMYININCDFCGGLSELAWFVSQMCRI